MISVTETELVAMVPTLAGSGNVVVTVNGKMLPAGYFSYDTTYRFSTIASNITSPWYLSVDDSNNVYFSNYNLQVVSKIDTQGAISTFVQNIAAMGTAIDQAGNLFVASNAGGGPFIDKIGPGGAITQIATDTGVIFGLAVDLNGNLYAANNVKSTIDKITPQGVVSVFASGLYYVSGVAVGRDGTVYTTNYSTPSYNSANGVISKISPFGQVSTLATGIYYDGETGIVLDDNNNLFVTSLNQGPAISSVIKITPAGTVSTISTDVSFPIGIAIDHKGNLYVADEQVSPTASYGAVVKLTPH